MYSGSGPPWRRERRRDAVCDQVVVAEDQAAARSAEVLVRRGGDGVDVWEWVRIQAGGDEPGERAISASR
jgi:hypothetical protein